jgi:hypothetical protein
MQLLNDLGLAVRLAGLLESLEKFFVLFVGPRTLLEVAVEVLQLQVEGLRLELKGAELVVVELEGALEKSQVGVGL